MALLWICLKPLFNYFQTDLNDRVWNVFTCVTSYTDDPSLKLFQILYNAKKTIKTAREQSNATKREDLMFLALDQFKEAEQMVITVLSA